MVFKISVINASIVCPKEAVLAWLEFLLDLGYAPEVTLMSTNGGYRERA